MNNEINVLILSCGTRNKIVQYFKKELNGRGNVIATDCSELAPALYEADKHYIVPRMTEENYLEVILSICKENKVNAVLSLIDPELSLLAKNKEKFLSIGTIPIISDYEIVELSFDKYEMYKYLSEQGINTVKSYVDTNLFYKDLEKGLIQFPVFVKPVRGSASININKVTTRDEIETLFSRYDNLIIQEYMCGKEYGADVYIDMISNEPVDIFVKEKLKMRAGETDKAVSVKDESLISLLNDFLRKTNYKGIIDIDIFKMNNEYYISEVNPRFGGGYPHAYESKVNVPAMIINNIENKVNKPNIGKYEEGIYMMKYNDVLIKKNESIGK